ncbi:MAG: cytidyltransferase-related domain protein [Pygmaiobacter massiliensis]|nr:cytidyltransferase-related domain protein [Pygmaiobacter massiliensis]
MLKRQVRGLLNALSGAFSNRRFLQKLSMPKKAAAALVRPSDWEGALSELLPITQRLTCGQLTELARPMLDKIAPEPPEGWMLYAYQTAVRMMFPDSLPADTNTPAQHDGAVCLLAVLQVLFTEERRSLPFDPRYDFAFCTERELAGSDRQEEYRRFLDRFEDEYIYEMMRLGCEVTPFRTLEHIAGVHHVAMYVARALANSSGAVDLPLISGAAAGHDLGKFGCKPGERVPYLHYYYTDYWFARRGIPTIGHIAANHSTWDLELENLSTESLALIYADFRVKQSRNADGQELTTIYPLDKSFQVILDKLDNVDETKRLRYEFVYAKLHDFEDYLRTMGVDVSLSGRNFMPPPQPSVSLIDPADAEQALRMMAVEHNLSLMHRLGHERLFGNILESARSAKSWKQLRAYISIFEEYFTYLTGTQKAQTLAFLYELLMHREGDIRRQAATLIGRIIAGYNLRYKKELPQAAPPDPTEQTQAQLWNQYLQMLVRPDHKLTAQQKDRIHYTLKIVVESLLQNVSPKELSVFLEPVLRCYDPKEQDEEVLFALLDTLLYLPLSRIEAAQLEQLLDFCRIQLTRRKVPLSTATLRFLCHFIEASPNRDQLVQQAGALAAQADCLDTPALIYLQAHILQLLGQDASRQIAQLRRPEIISDIFLDNLKTATTWILKAINIQLLVELISAGEQDQVMHIAAHFSNLIKVSENVVVRHTAGASLLKIATYLSPDQRNEIAVELAKGLEVGQYEFSKYIPQCLGEFSLWLRPQELDEMIGRMQQLMASANDSIVSAALGSVGEMLEHYGDYASRFGESELRIFERRQLMVGMVLKGLASYREPVRQEALLVLGKGLFGSRVLSYEDKSSLFVLACKKILFLIDEHRAGELTFFYRAAALSHIYRFLVLHRITSGDFQFETRQKVAFFPGTFDPFTLSHKGIVREIRDLGFEVYLAVDEFSWSKKAQPSLIRRQIVSMSVADEFHVQLFPHDIPVNIANPLDLERLARVFAGKTLFLAVGSDVVAHASSYKAPPSPHSVHSMNHIVFERVSGLHTGGEKQQPADLSCISGEVLRLQLPPHLEDISSTRIRENIDLNRDISNLIDPVVQDFIYQNSLYLREPQYKQLMGAEPLAFEFDPTPSPAFWQILAGTCQRDLQLAARLGHQLAESACGAMALYEAQPGQAKKLLGFAALRTVGSQQLLAAFGSAERADYVRGRTSGRILLICGIWCAGAKTYHALTLQRLLTEMLTSPLAEDCNFAVFLPLSGTISEGEADLLARQGFTQAPASLGPEPLFLTDMTAPVAIIQNLETTLKPPFSTNPRVLEAVQLAHWRLQQTICRLYPGSLVLTLDARVIHHRLVKKITQLNQVPETPTTPRQLGEVMCVPFGKMLRGNVVPNTVTKTIHTDKVYDPTITESKIEAFPYYPPLESQIRTIKSFCRPVVLVDDLLHSGDRMRALDPLFCAEGLEIRKVMVGLLSGRGRDLMETAGRSVDCVYFVPNLRGWFVESTLYPFIGGDTVRRSERSVPGLLPSVNLILPYATPKYYSEYEKSAALEYSKVCIRNARDVMLVLESEYRAHFGRNLTLSRLGEAVILPLCPDKGSCMSYDANLAASVYLENDLAMLDRMENALL